MDALRISVAIEGVWLGGDPFDVLGNSIYFEQTIENILLFY